MAATLKAVSIRTGQETNLARIKGEPSRKLPGRWKPIHASGSGVCCGVTIGTMDTSVQSCVGATVIPPYCPPLPPPTQDACRDAQATQTAITEALRLSGPIVVQPSPLQHPGFRGKRTQITKTRVVFGSTAGAIAAGTALLAAAGGTVGATALGITAVSVPATPNLPVELFNFVVPSASTAQVAKIRFGANSSLAGRTLFFQVWKSGNPGQLGEFQFIATKEIDLDIPCCGDDVISVMCRNPDAAGAWITHWDLDLWTCPTPTQDDSLYNRVLRSSPSLPPQPGCGQGSPCVSGNGG